MTNPLRAIESTTASARRKPKEENVTQRLKPFYPNYQAVPLAIPDALGLARTSSSGPNSEQPGTEKMSPESEYHSDFRPDTSSEGSNPADNEPIPDVRNEYYPKYFIDDFDDPHYLDVHVQYRIAGGLMKFKESDTGNEYHYAQYPGIEFIPYGVWSKDYNNIPPSEWTMCYETVQRVALLRPSNASRRPPSNAIMAG
jgi:hypothetical protein